MKIFFTLLMAMVGFTSMNAQLVYPVGPYSYILDSLVGSYINVFNVNVQYDSSSIGAFSGMEDLISIDAGLVFSTGSVGDVLGSSGDFASTNLGLEGDSLLSNIVGVATYDATFLEFDYIAQTNVLNFDFVFASEEYPEYVGSAFNDIFGFFVSGPGISGVENIALVPGTGDPVAINSINVDSNSTYYIANDSNIVAIQYDGLTVPMVAKLTLIPFETYHIKMVVSDVYDGIFDSAIFLKANSFGAAALQYDFGLVEDFYEQTIYEDSLSLEITVTLPDVALDDITYHFSYSGDAVKGVDYTAPDVMTFPAGTTTTTIKIKALSDGDIEGLESLILTVDELDDVLKINIEDNTLVGLNNLKEDVIQLFPNPATDFFSLPSALQAKKVDIYENTGKLVQSFESGFDRMDVSQLPKGIYYVQIIAQGKTWVKELKVK